MAAFVLVPSVARASGGGGCGRAVTDAAGTTVKIESFCFTPTIVRIDPGQVVTFTNADPVPHTVLGANGSWGGYDTLKPSKGVTYRFTEAGTYPYVCTYHVGMVGTVVVGDGDGGAIGTNTSKGPVVQVFARDLRTADASASLPVGGAGAWPVLALTAFGLLLVSVGSIVFGRMRKRAGSLNG